MSTKVSTIMTDIAPRRPGRFIPWIYVLGMLVVIAVNGVMIYCAMSTWPGMAAQHPYQEGVAYNRELAAEQRQEALGWELAARLSRGLGGMELRVEATDRRGQTLDGLKIKATVERPLGPAETERVELKPVAAGIYAASLASLASGQWAVRLAVSKGANAMYVSRRLMAP